MNIENDIEIKTFMDCEHYRDKYNGMITGRDICLQHFMPCSAAIRRGECSSEDKYAR